MTATCSYQPIAAIPTNRRKEIRVSLRDKYGLLSVDIRVHASNGVMFAPTAGGLAIRDEQLDDVIIALERAREALAQRKADRG